MASPSPPIDYTSRGYDELRADMLANAQTAGSPGYFPAWTAAANGGDPNDLGVALVELFAQGFDIVNYYVDRGAAEAHLSTLVLRSSALAVAQLLGYRSTPLTPARVTLAFTVQPGTGSVTVPALTQVATVAVPDVCAAVVFETDRDLVIPRSATQPVTGSVTATQGRTTAGEALGTGSGQSSQFSTLSQLGVLGGSVQVQVDEGGGPVLWTFADNLAGYGPNDNVFTTLETDIGTTVVLFGDGVYGRTPPSGSILTATYRTGVGSVGNVPAGSITDLYSQFVGSGVIQPSSSGYNAGAAAGGAEPETIASIRRNAPRVSAAAERCVTASDFAAGALQVSGIGDAAATALTYRNVFVYVAPVLGGQPDTATRTRVQQQLTAKAPIGTAISVFGPTYVPLTITASIVVMPSYNQNSVRLAAQNAITNLFTPDAASFGESVQGSTIYGALLSVPGVQSATVTVLTRTANPQATIGVQCAAGEIPQLTAGLQLTATGGVTATTGGSVGSSYGPGTGVAPSQTSAPNAQFTYPASPTGGQFSATVSWTPGTVDATHGAPTHFFVIMDFYQNGTYYQSQQFGAVPAGTNSMQINGTQQGANSARVYVRAFNGPTLYADSGATTVTYQSS